MATQRETLVRSGGVILLAIVTLVAGVITVVTHTQEKPQMIRFVPEGPSAGWGVTAADTSKTHLYYESEDNGGSSAGIWEARPFTREYENYSYAQFIYLLEGSLTLIDRNDGRQDTFKAGDAVLIPRGAAFTWKQTETVRKYFVIFDRATPASSTAAAGPTPTFVRVEENGPPGVGLIASPNGGPTKSHTYYRGADRSIVGAWATAPVTRQYNDTKFAQLMVFLKGEVTFRMPDGSTVIVKAGDAVLAPRGMDYTWESQDVHKFYVVFDQAPATVEVPPSSGS